MPRGVRVRRWWASLIDFGSGRRVPQGRRDDRPPRVNVDESGRLQVTNMLDLPGCPICRFVVASLQSSLVVGPEARGADVSSMRTSAFVALCDDHWSDTRVTTMTLMSATAVVRVCHNLLQSAEQDLASNPPTRESEGCPLCQLEEEVAARAFDFLSESWSDSDVQRRYVMSDGLCLPHLTRWLAFGEGEARRHFLVTQQEKIADRLASLGEFIRKHDYRYSSEELLESEVRSVRDAVRFVSGQWV